MYRRVSVAFLPLGASLLLSLPDTMLFFNHAAGAVVQAELLRTAMAAPGYPDQPSVLAVAPEATLTARKAWRLAAE